MKRRSLGVGAAVVALALVMGAGPATTRPAETGDAKELRELRAYADRLEKRVGDLERKLKAEEQMRQVLGHVVVPGPPITTYQFGSPLAVPKGQPREFNGMTYYLVPLGGAEGRVVLERSTTIGDIPTIKATEPKWAPAEIGEVAK